MATHSIWQGLGFALDGLCHAFKSQRSLRIESAAAGVVVVVGIVIGISRLEWIAVTISIFLIMGFELVNTAVEAATDLASPVHHPIAKFAKDTASAAVLVSAASGLFVGVIIFWPG